MAGDYLTSGAIHFTGLGNGTDFESIIEATVEVESFHINRLNAWKSDWETKQTAFTELNTDLLSLQTHMKSMDTMDEFMAKSATSSNSSVLTATADSAAEVGSHSIVVNQIAQTKIQTNTFAYADADSVVNSSGGALALTVNYGTNPAWTVNVPDGTTLEDLVDLVNNDADNPGVRASIISDGTNSYFQLRGKDQGAEFTLDTAGSTLVGYDTTPGNWDDNQVNQNSQIRVDGWPVATWVESASNTISGVVDGLTFSLKTAGTINLAVENDTETITENVRQFVDQINEVRTKLMELTQFDEVKQQGSILQGNYGLQIISSKLKDVTAGKAIGFDYDDQTLSSLSQIGITTDADTGSATLGLLQFDESIFASALATYPQATAELFGISYKGETNTSNFSYQSHIQGTTKAGTYKVAYTTDGTNITAATINGNTASISGNEITGAPGLPEAGLALKVLDLSAGNYTGEARIRLGKAGQMVEELEYITSETSGPLNILEKNYQDIINNIDIKIAYEEDRVARMERDLRNKYARLEATLGYYDGLQKSLESQISQLSSSS